VPDTFRASCRARRWRSFARPALFLLTLRLKVVPLIPKSSFFPVSPHVNIPEGVPDPNRTTSGTEDLTETLATVPEPTSFECHLS